MKRCSQCSIEKPLNQFQKNRARKDGVSVYCIPCSKNYYEKTRVTRLKQKKESYDRQPEVLRDRSKDNYRKDIFVRMLYSAKRRAKLKGIPFNISLEDIHIPKICPVLGIDLAINNHTSKDNSPSLDKIVPELGYVKGNVIVISMKANQIKTNATITELFRVYEFFKDKMPCE